MSPTSAASPATSSGEPSQASPQQAGTSSQVPGTAPPPLVPPTSDVVMTVAEGSTPVVPPSSSDAAMAAPEGSVPRPSDEVVTVPEASPRTSVEPNVMPTSATATVAPAVPVMAPPVTLGEAPPGPSVDTQVSVPSPSPTGVISAALARANTVDLVGGTPAPTAPGLTSAPSAPAPAPEDTSSALGFERAQQIS